MSKQYTSDGKRISSMTHARRTFTCTCGKTVAGNGGKSSHRRACDGRYLSWSEAYEQRVREFEANREGMRLPCNCVQGHRGDWWKHSGPDGTPESAVCEPFGGCSHPCPHRKRQAEGQA